MKDQRPDPDVLLERAREEGAEPRARLKIFFGAVAGVGKTYAMLLEARERRQAGTDVVVGVVETHGRPETSALLEGLEQLPPRKLEYRGATMSEFDLDAALRRRPKLLLLDELAHTNAPGSRHAKRWQDVDEILAAGIDVYTTLNVQHIDSLNDVVAQVTGVTVRETVPDSILDRADEIELVDIPPDDLMQRLRDGKVYLPVQAERALQNFFRKGNLIALRELALRKTAERVDAQLESHRRLEGISKTWDVRERLMVCVGNPEVGLALVREARRMAAALHADWLVVHVERPGEVRPDPEKHAGIVALMGFAEELGAHTATLSGHRVGDELLAFARQRHVSRILIGKPTRAPWVQALAGSLTSTLLRSSTDIDVYVVDARREKAESPHWTPAGPRSPIAHYPRAVAIVAVATGLCALLAPHFDRTNLVMIYLIAVLITAVRYGRGPAVLASVLGVAAFDFFFVPPHLNFAVSDTQYVVTFAVMLGAALLVSALAVRLREQAEEARRREQRTAALYALSRDMAGTPSEVELLETIAARVRETFDCDAVLFVAGGDGRVSPRTAPRRGMEDDPRELGVAQWVFDHGKPAGAGSDTLPSARGLYQPLLTPRGAVGVLGIYPGDLKRLAAPDQTRLLETFANQIALSLERSQLSMEAERSRVVAESERLRNALLSSVSHDLRTPLASITGATTTLLRPEGPADEKVRRELLQSVADEADRLNRLVANLLEMTRVEGGQVRVRKEWHSMEEIVGVALARLERQFANRPVEVDLPHGLPLVPCDEVAIEQVLLNLLENATKYSPAGSTIGIRASSNDRELAVEILDRGPGVPAGDEELVFEKFYRGREDRHSRGTGLGLAICRAIVRAHGGTIGVRRRDGGGAVFRFTLPRDSEPPPVPSADAAEGSGSK